MVEKNAEQWKIHRCSICECGGDDGQIYKLNNSHPTIISTEAFQTVQEEKIRRSNVELTSDGIKRKSQKYSLKQSDNQR